MNTNTSPSVEEIELILKSVSNHIEPHLLTKIIDAFRRYHATQGEEAQEIAKEIQTFAVQAKLVEQAESRAKEHRDEIREQSHINKRQSPMENLNLNAIKAAIDAGGINSMYEENLRGSLENVINRKDPSSHSYDYELLEGFSKEKGIEPKE